MLNWIVWNSVVYWPLTPPNMPFQRRRKCIFHWHGRVWLMIWDRVKIPRYSHRLMHRKRVSCELHDSYIRLMMIKHAIPEILSGRLNYYITLWRQEVSQFGDQTRWWQDAVEKASTQQSGPLGLRLSSPGERERHNADGHKSGGQYIAVFVQPPTPSHSKTLSNPFEPFQIKWEVYFSKNWVARFYCVVVIILHAHVDVLCVCIVNHGHGYCVTIQ